MRRYLRIMSAVVVLYPWSGMAKHNATPQIDDRVTAIWDACDRRFGPAPDPAADADRQRANDVVECFRQVQRKLRDMPITS